MRKLQNLAVKASAVVSSLLLGSAAFAQTSGTTTAPATVLDMVTAIDFGEVKVAALTITGLMITFGLVLWGARLVAAKFHPKI